MNLNEPERRRSGCLENPNGPLLTEEEKHNIVEELQSSDICGLKTLESLIYARAERRDLDEDLIDLVTDVIKLNGMVAMGESFSGIYCDNHDQIWELYYTMKMALLELCGITDKYWND